MHLSGAFFPWGHTTVPGLLGSQGLFLKLLGDPWEGSCLWGAAGPHCGSSGVIPGRHHTQGWPLVYSFGECSIIALSLSCLKLSASLA